MAKRKVNKSQAVRDLLTTAPDKPVKEIVSILAGNGIKVTPNLVYFIKAKGKAKKRRKARQKAQLAVATSNAGTGAIAAQNPVVLIQKVKELAASVGGLKKLAELVEILRQ